MVVTFQITTTTTYYIDILIDGEDLKIRMRVHFLSVRGELSIESRVFKQRCRGVILTYFTCGGKRGYT